MYIFLLIKIQTMKRTAIFCTLTLGLMSLGISTKAQETASATATATIVTPIAITKVVDMNFGNVAVQSTTGGTVVLSPAGARTPSGGVTLPTNNGTVAAASFTVTGVATYSYSITLPSTDLTITSGSNTMIVNNFTSNPSGPNGLLTAGTQTLRVGATLNVNAAQPAGTYVSGTPFDVTVNYN